MAKKKPKSKDEDEDEDEENDEEIDEENDDEADEEADEEEESPKPRKSAMVSQQAPSAFEQMRQLGYPTYTVAEKFELTNLDMERRPYPIAKKIDLYPIKEDDGHIDYIGLGMVGVLDEKLFLMAIRKGGLHLSIANSKAVPETEYIGIEFFGVSKGFGPIGIVAMPRNAYLKFVEMARSLK